MAGEAVEHEQQGDNGAARAFSDMAAELAVLRRAVEAFDGKLERARARNYDATLGGIQQGLAEVGKLLGVVGEAPGVKTSPGAWAQAARQVGDDSERRLVGHLEMERQKLQSTAAELGGYVAQAATAKDQFRRQRAWGAGGAAVGVVLCLSALSLARTLPAGWGLREKMATWAMVQDRWSGGARMLQTADPRRWAIQAAALALVQANGAELDACQAEARSTGKVQRCTIKVEPPAP